MPAPICFGDRHFLVRFSRQFNSPGCQLEPVLAKAKTARRRPGAYSDAVNCLGFIQKKDCNHPKATQVHRVSVHEVTLMVLGMFFMFLFVVANVLGYASDEP